jgi:hypothetical protein
MRQFIGQGSSELVEIREVQINIGSVRPELVEGLSGAQRRMN